MAVELEVHQKGAPAQQMPTSQSSQIRALSGTWQWGNLTGGGRNLVLRGRQIMTVIWEPAGRWCRWGVTGRWSQHVNNYLAQGILLLYDCWDINTMLGKYRQHVPTKNNGVSPVFSASKGFITHLAGSVVELVFRQNNYQ
jgi:hypothetical protein